MTFPVLFEICVTALLPYLLITAKSIESEKSLLLTCKISGLLINTLAPDEKYAFLNRDNLTIPIQMQLSEKEKTFSQFLDAFFKSSLNLKHFERENDPHNFCISKFTDSKNVVR